VLHGGIHLKSDYDHGNEVKVCILHCEVMKSISLALHFNATFLTIHIWSKLLKTFIALGSVQTFNFCNRNSYLFLGKYETLFLINT